MQSGGEQATVGDRLAGFAGWGFCDPAAGSSVLAAGTAAAQSSSSYGIPAVTIAAPFVERDSEFYGYRQQQQRRYLTCLKLGKRQHCGRGGAAEMDEAAAETKRAAPAARVPVPRCQVEGCDKALVNAKEYHKRHKVCEMHSKAPCAVVLGAEQRFCQQCSRFHIVSEFDEAKRSCRRRLAGHNERRRKSGNGNPSLESTIMNSRISFMPNSPSSALSLLSSKATPCVTPELSSRSSAALRELIAENRASLFAKHLFTDWNGWQFTGQTSSSSSLCHDPYQHQLPFQIPAQVTNGCNHLQAGSGNHLTLDLMQIPTSSVEFISGRNKSKVEDEDECCEIWKSFETHVV